MTQPAAGAIYTDITVQVPFNTQPDLVEPIVTNLKSKFNIRDGVCQVYELRLVWNQEAVSQAKKFILEALQKWDGSKDLEFVIAFTNSAETKLMEFTYLKYFIEKNHMRWFTGECCNELEEALEESDAKEIYAEVDKRVGVKNQDFPYRIDSAMPKVHRLIKNMNFKEFANKLDTDPRRVQLEIREIPVDETAGLLLSSVLRSMPNDTPFKVTLSHPNGGTIKLRTTRWKGSVRLTVKNFAENTSATVEYFRKMITTQGLNILHQNTVMLEINLNLGEKLMKLINADNVTQEGINESLKQAFASAFEKH